MIKQKQQEKEHKQQQENGQQSKQQQQDGTLSQNEYTIRRGTINFGREYEHKMTALLCLRCILDGAKDLWLASNPDGTGAFDDVILHVTKDNNVTFLLQLKHQQDPKTIQEDEFVAPNSDFSLSKYFTDINKLHEAISQSDEKQIVKDIAKSDEIYFVLYTNKGVTECKYLEQHPDKKLDFLNTSSDSTTNIYKVNNVILQDGTSLSTVNKHNNIFLFPNQVNASGVDKVILSAIKKIVKAQINIEFVAENFVKYIKDWLMGTLGGHYYLLKKNILCKLTELVLCQYEVRLGNEKFRYYDCSKKRIWNNILANKTITVVGSNKAVKDFLIQYIGSEVFDFCKQPVQMWKEYLSEKRLKIYQQNTEFKMFMVRHVGLNKTISMLDIYKFLWRAKSLPLILEIETSEDYKNILNVLQLSDYFYKVIVINKGMRLPQRKKGEMKRFETMNDLDEDEREEMLQQFVKIQGRGNGVLKDYVDENTCAHITCADILKILCDDFNIGNQLKPLPKHFIPRTIIKTVVKSQVLQNHAKEIFLLLNISKPSNYNAIKLEEVNFNDPQRIPGIILIEQEISLEDLKLAKKPIHILSAFGENYFEYRWSYGSTTTIKTFCVDVEIDLENEDLNNLLHSTSLVSGSPGMGKTILMDYLTHRVPTNKWVLRIDLNMHQTYFRHENCKNSWTAAIKHLNYFYEVIHEEDPTNRELNWDIFQKFADTRNVMILLDGFDEVAVSYKKEATNLAKSLNKEDYSLWITTRPFMKLHLENELKTTATTLKAFTTDDQEQFLIKYYINENYDLDSPSKKAFIEEFVKRLLKAARRNLADGDVEFTGIPLQTKLLAEMFSHDCKEYLRSNGEASFNENFDLVYLYQNFIDKKLEIFIDKFGESANDIYVMIKEHQSLFALKLVFSLDNIVEVMKNLYKFYKDDPNRLQLLQRQGVLTADEEFNINYIHRTFAEYLSAEWLSANLYNDNQEIKEFARDLINERFTGNYKFLFSIFDRILATDCPLHLAVINGAINVKDLDVNGANILDKGERSALHIAALHGVHLPMDTDEFPDISGDMMLDLIKKILSCNISPDGFDAMGYTALDYAFANCCLHVANEIHPYSKVAVVRAYVDLKYEEIYFKYCLTYHSTLFKTVLFYFASRNLLLRNIETCTTVHSYTDKYFSPAYNTQDYTKQYNSMTVIEMLKSEEGCVYSGHIKRNNASFYRDMRYAVAFGSPNNVNELLIAGAEINKQDLDKSTLLHYAVVHERTKIVKLLLTKGVNINKQNNENNTPLHLALLNGNEEIIKLLLSSAAGVDITNNNGDTALHLATKFYKKRIFERFRKNIIWVTIMQRFISSKGNVNEQNKRGDTPLHYAAKRGSDYTVTELLNNQAQLDKQNIEGEAPLHWASMYDNEEIVRIFISKGANLNLEAEGGYTSLHVAVCKGALKCVKLLLTEGANVEGVTKKSALRYEQPSYSKLHEAGNTLLHLVPQKNGVDIANALIASGASLNVRNERGNTPLTLMLETNNIDVVYTLINNGADVNLENKFGSTPLHLVPKIEGVNIAKLLLAKGANINAVDIKRSTPLNAMLEKGNVDVGNILIEKGACINLIDCTGTSPLHNACFGGHLKFVELLIAKGAAVYVIDNNGFTPLCIAFQRGFKDVAKLLITKTVDINVTNGYGYDTPLHLSIVYDNAVAVSMLIARGANLNAINRKGNTPLHLASKRFYTNIIDIFLARGANTNIKNFDGETALHLASRNNRTATAKLLLEKTNVDVRNNHGNTPLHLACEEIDSKGTYKHIDIEGRTDIVKLLIGHGASINEKNNYGDTPLHLAAKENHTGSFEILIANDADVNVTNNAGDTPLHLAWKTDTITKVLIAKGADVNIRNANDDTPLHLVSQKCGTKAVIALMSNNADINAINKNGDTPLHLVSQKYYSDCVEILIAEKADVNVKNNNGNTPIHCLLQKTKSEQLVKKDRYKIAQLLLNAKADITTRNANDHTPLDLALQNNFDDIVTLLRELR